MNASNPTAYVMPPMRSHNATDAQREQAADLWWQERGREAIAWVLAAEDNEVKRERLAGLRPEVTDGYDEWRDGERARIEGRQREEALLNESKRKGRG